MKKIVISLLIVCVSLLSLGASKATVIPLSSELYTNVEELYLLQGVALPSQAKPWSYAEVELMLNRLNKNRFTALEHELYSLVLRTIEEDKQAITFGVNINAEMYAHTNPTEFSLDTDWIYGYDSRNPFAKAYMEIQISDFLYSYGELAYGYGRVTMYDSLLHIEEVENWIGIGALIPKEYDPAIVAIVTSSDIYGRGFLFNLPPIDMIELDTPRRALISVGGDNWLASFSRDKIEWGNSHIGNFIFDSHVDYQEYLRVKLFTDKLSLDTVFMFMDTNYNSPAYSTFSGPGQLFLTHRLEVRPWSFLSIAVSENVMYQYEIFEGRYLNPAFIYHNLNNSDLFNALAHIELSIVPFTGLHLYGQFVLDQATAPTEPDKEAPAWGFSTGLTYSKALNKGVLSSTVEFAYTTPLLYRRDKIDFLMFHKYSINWHPSFPFYKVLVFDYIGFPYGGDSQVFLFEVGYRVPSVMHIQLRSLFSREGEMNFYTAHSTNGKNTGKANIRDATPYGNKVSDSFTLGVSGEYNLPELIRFVDISLFGEIDYVARRLWYKDFSAVERSSDWQFSFGLSFTL